MNCLCTRHRGCCWAYGVVVGIADVSIVFSSSGVYKCLNPLKAKAHSSQPLQLFYLILLFYLGTFYGFCFYFIVTEWRSMNERVAFVRLVFFFFCFICFESGVLSPGALMSVYWVYLHICTNPNWKTSYVYFCTVWFFWKTHFDEGWRVDWDTMICFLYDRVPVLLYKTGIETNNHQCEVGFVTSFGWGELWFFEYLSNWNSIVGFSLFFFLYIKCEKKVYWIFNFKDFFF